VMLGNQVRFLLMRNLVNVKTSVVRFHYHARSSSRQTKCYGVMGLSGALGIEQDHCTLYRTTYLNVREIEILNFCYFRYMHILIFLDGSTTMSSFGYMFTLNKREKIPSRIMLNKVYQSL
jgi:hypothetical protein